MCHLLKVYGVVDGYLEVDKVLLIFGMGDLGKKCIKFGTIRVCLDGIIFIVLKPFKKSEKR